MSKCKVIADYLGLVDHNGFYDGWDLNKAGLPFSPGAMGNGTRRLLFDKSWDWIMPVIIKIEYETGYCLVMSPGYAYWTKDGKEILEDFEGYGSGVGAIFTAVVEFLEWWKENNKEETI